MNADFWLQKWQKNEIGFHQSEVNSLLAKYFDKLSLPNNGRVFLPLCGKSLDIAWLLSKGCRVTGVELSQIAIEQLFVALKVQPKVTKLDKLELYSAPHLDIFVGDFFELSHQILGAVDATYDRAALVALPEEMRKRYTTHLAEITETAPQLLLTFEYDQSVMQGPPFSVGADEVQQHYRDIYQLSLLKQVSVPGGLKGKCTAVESAWLLTESVQ